MRWIAPVLLLALGCGPKQPVTTALHTSDGFIRDGYGRAVILRGMQMAGSQKTSPYLDFTLTDYQRVHDWGFNSVRFLMVWAAIEPQEGQYDQTYLSALAERMDWAQQAGLSVILDMHQDIYGEGFGFDGAADWPCASSYYTAFMPRTPWDLDALDPNVEACFDQFYAPGTALDHFTEAWRQVALAVKDKPAVIGFDLLNEPEWGSANLYTFEYTTLEPFYEHVVPVIRSVAPNWVAFLEPASSRNLGFPTSLKPFPFDNVVYSPHSYDVTAETSGVFPSADAPGLISNVASLSQEAQSLHTPLWVGEYGGADTDPNIAAYMNAEYTAFGNVAASSSYWSYDLGGYSPLDADGGVVAPLLDSIALPYPSLVAGDPISYAFDPTSSTFTFSYTPDTKISEPTEIVVPTLAYPDGFQISCGGCETTKTATGVTITKPASGATTTVTITP